MTYQITLEKKAAVEDLSILGEGIEQHARKLFPDKTRSGVTFFLRDESGAIVGGVAGTTQIDGR